MGDSMGNCYNVRTFGQVAGNDLGDRQLEIHPWRRLPAAELRQDAPATRQTWQEPHRPGALIFELARGLQTCKL